MLRRGAHHSTQKRILLQATVTVVVVLVQMCLDTFTNLIIKSTMSATSPVLHALEIFNFLTP